MWYEWNSRSGQQLKFGRDWGSCVQVSNLWCKRNVLNITIYSKIRSVAGLESPQQVWQDARFGLFSRWYSGFELKTAAGRANREWERDFVYLEGLVKGTRTERQQECFLQRAKKELICKHHSQIKNGGMGAGGDRGKKKAEKRYLRALLETLGIIVTSLRSNHYERRLGWEQKIDGDAGG